MKKLFVVLFLLGVLYGFFFSSYGFQGGRNAFLSQKEEKIFPAFLQEEVSPEKNPSLLKVRFFGEGEERQGYENRLFSKEAPFFLESIQEIEEVFLDQVLDQVAESEAFSIFQQVYEVLPNLGKIRLYQKDTSLLFQNLIQEEVSFEKKFASLKSFSQRYESIWSLKKIEESLQERGFSNIEVSLGGEFIEIVAEKKQIAAFLGAI